MQEAGLCLAGRGVNPTRGQPLYACGNELLAFNLLRDRFEWTLLMATIILDCPRCDAARMTFDTLATVPLIGNPERPDQAEFSASCRGCGLMSVFEAYMHNGVIYNRVPNITAAIQSPFDLGQFYRFMRFVSLADIKAQPVPTELPEIVDSAFQEGVRCLAIGANNAAATMFRLSLDLATKDRLPDPSLPDGPNARVRSNLAARLEWLFQQGHLPGDLQPMSTVIRDHGNDGAHEGCLDGEEADDIYDFTYLFMDRIYTQPALVEAASQRRQQRRAARQPQ